MSRMNKLQPVPRDGSTSTEQVWTSLARLLCNPRSVCLDAETHRQWRDVIVNINVFLSPEVYVKT